jgi:3-hydroxyisobutyrate dehydrogenase-like beta-hydroxyacid dehydrogenase
MSKGSTETIGIIGLGIMGLAIARNLIGAKMEVRGYDVDPTRMAMLSDLGGIATSSAADAAAGATLALTSLPSVAALDATVENLLAGGLAGLTVAELST